MDKKNTFLGLLLGLLIGISISVFAATVELGTSTLITDQAVIDKINSDSIAQDKSVDEMANEIFIAEKESELRVEKIRSLMPDVDRCNKHCTFSELDALEDYIEKIPSVATRIAEEESEASLIE